MMFTFEMRGKEGLHITDGMQIQNRRHWIVLFFRAISRMTYVLKEVFLISDRFKCKILLNHHAWKFYLKLPENKPTRQELYSVFRRVADDI